MPGPSYFQVVKPMRIWRHLGTSPSNSYYGSSRIINTVKSAENAKPGDAIHLLPSGVYLVRDNIAYPISLAPTKPPFEKTYLVITDEERMAKAVESNLAAEADKPAVDPDYKAARDLVFDNKMRELHPEVIETEISNEMVRLHKIASSIDAALEASLGGEPVKWRFQDINADGPSRATATIGDENFVLYAHAHREDEVIVKMDVVRLEAAGVNADYSYEGRGNVDIGDDDMVDLVERAWASAPSPAV